MNISYRNPAKTANDRSHRIIFLLIIVQCSTKKQKQKNPGIFGLEENVLFVLKKKNPVWNVFIHGRYCITIKKIIRERELVKF